MQTKKPKRKSTWMKGFVFGLDKKDDLALSQAERSAQARDWKNKGRTMGVVK